MGSPVRHAAAGRPRQGPRLGAALPPSLVTAAYTTLVTEGTWSESDWTVLEEKIRTVTQAGWWLDQRDTKGTDLPELLDAATSEDVGTENPFR